MRSKVQISLTYKCTFGVTPSFLLNENKENNLNIFKIVSISKVIQVEFKLICINLSTSVTTRTLEVTLRPNSLVYCIEIYVSLG